jgi:hypothetical protein
MEKSPMNSRLIERSKEALHQILMAGLSAEMAQQPPQDPTAFRMVQMEHLVGLSRLLRTVPHGKRSGVYVLAARLDRALARSTATESFDELDALLRAALEECFVGEAGADALLDDYRRAVRDRAGHLIASGLTP